MKTNYLDIKEIEKRLLAIIEEQKRINDINEETRIINEETRIINEETLKIYEETRIINEKNTNSLIKLIDNKENNCLRIVYKRKINDI